MLQSVKNVWYMMQKLALMLMVALLIGSLIYSDTSAQQGPPDNIETPFQAQLGQSIRARQTAGLPVPQITVRSETETFLVRGEEVTEIIATTEIEFNNPLQAGYEEWPEFVIEDHLPNEMGGELQEGNYTEDIYQELEEDYPTIWDTYEKGKEPRTYSYTENILVPTQSITSSIEAAFLEVQASANEDILMGFTYQGPQLAYSIGATFSVPIPVPPFTAEVASFNAGFSLDWAAGLRLPANVDITGSSPMVLGESYDFESTLLTKNWSASDYSSYGVAPENGNEFVFRANFNVYINAEIIAIGDLCENCSFDIGFDESRTFETPLGDGAEFPVPTIQIPVYDIDVTAFAFSVGFEIDPSIGSDELRASWRALPGTDAQGSGELVYTFDGETVTFGSVQACNLNDSINEATIEIYDFEYAFTQFEIDLNAFLNFELFGFGGEVANPTLFTLDLSPITGALYLPDHVQCTVDFDCSFIGPDNRVQLTVPVVDLDAPISQISLDGTLGNNGWYKSNVDVTLSADDQPAGCGNGVDYTEYSFDGESFQTYTTPLTITDEGSTTVYYRSVDVDSNVEITKTLEILIDKTPPEITCNATTLPNEFGWYNTNVTITWDATDTISGIFFVSPDETIMTEGANQSRSGYAEDFAGWISNCSVDGINIDKTPPEVVINQPEPITYDNTESFNIDWVVTDNLSGIQSETGYMDGTETANGELIQLLIFAAGDHTFLVEALDFADNFNNASVSFFVDVDIDGLIASVDFMCGEGIISKGGICNALQAKLNAAKRAMERGQNKTACNILDAFANQVSAQSGKSIVPDMADILIGNAEYVCDNLPDSEEPGPAVEEEIVLVPLDTEPETPASDDSAEEEDSLGNGNGNANGNSNGNSNGNGQSSNNNSSNASSSGGQAPSNSNDDAPTNNSNGNANGRSADHRNDGNHNGNGTGN